MNTGFTVAEAPRGARMVPYRRPLDRMVSQEQPLEHQCCFGLHDARLCLSATNKYCHNGGHRRPHTQPLTWTCPLDSTRRAIGAWSLDGAPTSAPSSMNTGVIAAWCTTRCPMTSLPPAARPHGEPRTAARAPVLLWAPRCSPVPRDRAAESSGPRADRADDHQSGAHAPPDRRRLEAHTFGFFLYFSVKSRAPDPVDLLRVSQPTRPGTRDPTQEAVRRRSPSLPGSLRHHRRV
jgi:hypothetical protein